MQAADAATQRNQARTARGWRLKWRAGIAHGCASIRSRRATCPSSRACLEQWTRSEHFHLKEMCTAIEHQHRGIGGAVLDALARELAARSVSVIFLETRAGSNASAFYRKHGFSALDLEMLRRCLS